MFNLDFGNMPKTKTRDDFEKMFRAGFDPLKQYIQYNKLANKLTPDDLHMMAHALAQGLLYWCDWLKKVDEEAERRKDGYG
jgi:hypothetical protein